MAGASNDVILQRLRDGNAAFEVAPSPVPFVMTHSSSTSPLFASVSVDNPRFFARIGQSVTGGSPAKKRAEVYSVRKVTGDGRCLFSCPGMHQIGHFCLDLVDKKLSKYKVKGMALNKGLKLSAREETENADELRMAVKEIICDSKEEHSEYQEALMAIEVEQPLKQYCRRIGKANFWGGESELLVLSKLCRQTIVVYIPEHEHGGRGGSGFIPIQEYGMEFRKSWKLGNPVKVVRLLYSGKNRYDLLV